MHGEQVHMERNAKNCHSIELERSMKQAKKQQAIQKMVEEYDLLVMDRVIGEEDTKQKWRSFQKEGTKAAQKLKVEFCDCASAHFKFLTSCLHSCFRCFH